MDKALENIMILLQRRYNFLREIGRLTDELAEATERRDTVSASLLLEMRGEQMERHAACEGELRRQTEEEVSLRRKLYAIALGPISPAQAAMIQKIREIRVRTQSLIEQIRAKDSMLARRVRHR